MASFVKGILKGKTRSANLDKRVEYLGAGCELLENDLPTLRACLRYLLFLKDETSAKHQEFDKNGLAREVYRKVTSLYYKANANLVPPAIISENTFVQKLLRIWDDVNTVVRKQKGFIKINKKLFDQLDKLFDILSCQCSILCVEKMPSSENDDLCSGIYLFYG